MYGGFTVTDNTAVTANSFSPYCITATADARLPGGGGNQICGLFDVTPTLLGQTSNQVTPAKNFGTQREVYNGVDVSLNARFGRGGVLMAGVSLGRMETDSCFANTLPNITTNSTGLGLPAGTTMRRTRRLLQIVPPWSAGTQFKANGIYPLPGGGSSRASRSRILQVRRSWPIRLSRRAHCPLVGPQPRGLPGWVDCDELHVDRHHRTASVAAGVSDRVSILNLAFAKVFNIGPGRVRGMLDVYNVFNVSMVLNGNNTFSVGATSTWQPADQPRWRPVVQVRGAGQLLIGTLLSQ